MTYTAGDILLVRDYSGGSDLLGNLIMAGERARYGNSGYSVWTHSAMIVDNTGVIVEAQAQGVVKGHASEYAHKETLIISPPNVSADKRAYAVAFALAQVGAKYDVVDFVSLALSLLTGVDWSLHSDTRFICSGLCARATECYTTNGYQFPSEAMLPADLGDYWHALPDAPLPPLAFFGRLLDRFKTLCWSLSPFTKGLKP